MRDDARASTGIDGLDTVLDGGLLPNRSHLLRGGPGTGKTVLGFPYLTAGAAAGESTPFVNSEEPVARVRENPATRGFDFDGVEFLDLTSGADAFTVDRTYGVFAADDVVLGEPPRNRRGILTGTPGFTDDE